MNCKIEVKDVKIDGDIKIITIICESEYQSKEEFDIAVSKNANDKDIKNKIREEIKKRRNVGLIGYKFDIEV